MPDKTYFLVINLCWQDLSFLPLSLLYSVLCGCSAVVCVERLILTGHRSKTLNYQLCIPMQCPVIPSVSAPMSKLSWIVMSFVKWSIKGWWCFLYMGTPASIQCPTIKHPQKYHWGIWPMAFPPLREKEPLIQGLMPIHLRNTTKATAQIQRVVKVLPRNMILRICRTLLPLL